MSNTFYRFEYQYRDMTVYLAYSLWYSACRKHKDPKDVLNNHSSSSVSNSISITQIFTKILLALKRACAITPLTPNVNYSGRTAPLTSKVAFYMFIQQI